jgi:purine-nucleoside phosphorylase
MTPADIIRQRAGAAPIAAGLILGSGLSDLGNALADKVTIPFAELQGFPGYGHAGGGVSGHGRDLLIGTMGGKRIAVLTGRAHFYEQGSSAVMRPAIETLAALGAHTLLLTNSAGSLLPAVGPGELLMLTDHINYNGPNPLIGEPTDKRFVNMVDAYDPALREKAKACAHKLGIALAQGTYLWYAGPSFETPAEIRMAKILGADAVGMSTVPETILARMLGLKVWACSSITNMGAGLSSENISHEHTKSMAVQGAAKLQKLIPALVEEL